jgi:ribosomal protein S18 acetylase RimI-like enzyme
LRIRPVEPSDRARILEIVTATGNFTAVEIVTALEVVDEAMADASHPHGDYRCFAAEDDHGRVAGYECHGPTPLTEGTYDLYWIAVDPSYQGAGFGRALLAFAENETRAAGGRLLLIETSSQESYGDTIRFYEKSGYPLVARLKGFYRPGDDKLIFARELGPGEALKSPDNGAVTDGGPKTEAGTQTAADAGTQTATGPKIAAAETGIDPATGSGGDMGAETGAGTKPA